MKALKLIIRRAAFIALVYAWLGIGSAGAGNVAMAWAICGVFVGSIRVATAEKGNISERWIPPLWLAQADFMVLGIAAAAMIWYSAWFTAVCVIIWACCRASERADVTNRRKAVSGAA